MKLLLTSLTVLIGTTVVATAQINGLNADLLSGIKGLATVTFEPSTYGVIGAITLIGVISARRLKVN